MIANIKPLVIETINVFGDFSNENDIFSIN
jgi:hypothetical protein